MTQEQKQLLLIDICARLPYGVIVQDRNGTHILTPGNTELGTEYIKPYLRPLSSMSEEEEREYLKLWDLQNEYPTDADIRFKIDVIDWLNAHHFDYRGLILMGLALEAKEGMYD